MFIFCSPAGLTGKAILNSFLLGGDTFPNASRSARESDAIKDDLERLEKLGKLKERDGPVDI